MAVTVSLVFCWLSYVVFIVIISPVVQYNHHYAANVHSFVSIIAELSCYNYLISMAVFQNVILRAASKHSYKFCGHCPLVTSVKDLFELRIFICH